MHHYKSCEYKWECGWFRKTRYLFSTNCFYSSGVSKWRNVTKNKTAANNFLAQNSTSSYAMNHTSVGYTMQAVPGWHNVLNERLPAVLNTTDLAFTIICQTCHLLKCESTIATTERWAASWLSLNELCWVEEPNLFPGVWACIGSLNKWTGFVAN